MRSWWKGRKSRFRPPKSAPLFKKHERAVRRRRNSPGPGCRPQCACGAGSSRCTTCHCRPSRLCSKAVAAGASSSSHVRVAA